MEQRDIYLAEKLITLYKNVTFLTYQPGFKTLFTGNTPFFGPYCRHYIKNKLFLTNSQLTHFPIEEIFNKLLDLEDTSRSSNKNNFINILFLQISIFQHLLDRFDC